MIACPSCSTHLTREKSPEGVFWRCESCEGRLLAVPVARKILDKKLVNGLWIASGDFTLDRKRECPLCRNLMPEVQSSATAHPLHIDLCRSCHYLWFDTHELAALAEQAPISPDDIPADVKARQMPAKAREMMALFMAESVKRKADEQEMIKGEAPETEWKALATVLGLPAEEETEPLKRAPWLTWALAAIMLAVYLLTFSALRSWIDNWGLIPDQAFRNHGLTWITSIFLHGGFWHLLGNAYFFLIFADNVEDYLGKIKFLILFFLAAFAGDALHMAFEARSSLPSVGASGAISGIIAFYALQFPKARICLMIHFALVYIRWIRIPAWGAFLLWLGLQAVVILEQLFGGHVSGLAHVGGALIGFLFWLIHRIRFNDVERHSLK